MRKIFNFKTYSEDYLFIDTPLVPTALPASSMPELTWTISDNMLPRILTNSLNPTDALIHADYAVLLTVTVKNNTVSSVPVSISMYRNDTCILTNTAASVSANYYLTFKGVDTSFKSGDTYSLRVYTSPGNTFNFIHRSITICPTTIFLLNENPNEMLNNVNLEVRNVPIFTVGNISTTAGSYYALYYPNGSDSVNISPPGHYSIQLSNPTRLYDANITPNINNWSSSTYYPYVSQLNSVLQTLSYDSD